MVFKRMFRKKLDKSEDRVLNLTLRHVSVCREAVESLREAVLNLVSGDMDKFKQYLETVHSKEEEADELRRALVEELARGVLPPLSREDFTRLVIRADLIADWSREAARILEVEGIQKNICEKDFCRILVEMLDHALKCSQALEKAVTEAMTDFKACLKSIHEIEEMEEEADTLYVKGLARLCKLVFETPSQYLLFGKLLEYIENICDSCEDVSDVLKVIIVRALR